MVEPQESLDSKGEDYESGDNSAALSFCQVIPAAEEPEGQIRDSEGNTWIHKIFTV